MQFSVGGAGGAQPRHGKPQVNPAWGGHKIIFKIMKVTPGLSSYLWKTLVVAHQAGLYRTDTVGWGKDSMG